MTLLFADISEYQAQVDWTKVQLPLVFARATLGLTYQDVKFITHRTNAGVQNIPFGAYHYITEGNGAAQAAHFLAVLGPNLDRYFGLMLDIELHGLTRQTIDDFVTYWRKQTTRPLFQYGPEGVLAAVSGAANGPLWLANYPGGGYPGDDYPLWHLSFAGWSAPTLWQYGPFRDPGFPNNIDGDAFRGTLAQLAVLMGAQDMTFENTFTPFVADFTAGATLYSDAARTLVDTKGWAGGTLIGVAGVGNAPQGAFPDAAILINLSAGGAARKLVYIGADHMVPGSLKVRPGTIFPATGFTQAQLDAAVAAQQTTDAAAAAAALNAAVAAQKATDSATMAVAVANATAQGAAQQKQKDVAAVQGA